MIACCAAAAWMHARICGLAGRGSAEQDACDAFRLPGFKFADGGVEVGRS